MTKEEKLAQKRELFTAVQFFMLGVGITLYVQNHTEGLYLILMVNVLNVVRVFLLAKPRKEPFDDFLNDNQ